MQQLVEWLSKDGYDVYFDMRQNPSRTDWSLIKKEIEDRDVLLIMLGIRYRHYFENGPEAEVSSETGGRRGAGVDTEAAVIERLLDSPGPRHPMVLLLPQGQTLEDCCPSCLKGRSRVVLPRSHTAKTYKELRKKLDSAIWWNRDSQNLRWYHPKRIYVRFSDWLTEKWLSFQFGAQLAWKTMLLLLVGLAMVGCFAWASGIANGGPGIRPDDREMSKRDEDIKSQLEKANNSQIAIDSRLQDVERLQNTVNQNIAGINASLTQISADLKVLPSRELVLAGSDRDIFMKAYQGLVEKTTDALEKSQEIQGTLSSVKDASLKTQGAVDLLQQQFTTFRDSFAAVSQKFTNIEMSTSATVDIVNQILAVVNAPPIPGSKQNACESLRCDPAELLASAFLDPRGRRVTAMANLSSGISAFQDRDYAAALVFLERAICNDPSRAAAYYYQALAKRHLWSTAEALPDLVQGALVERRFGQRDEVSSILEPVQGEERKWIERARVDVQSIINNPDTLDR